MASKPFAAVLSRLHAHRDAHQVDMRAAFAQDEGRFSEFSLQFEDLLLDWSKCAVDAKTMTMLAELADAAGVEKRRAAMFAGDKINVTENRAVTLILSPRDFR